MLGSLEEHSWREKIVAPLACTKCNETFQSRKVDGDSASLSLLI